MGLANRSFGLIESDSWWRERGYFSPGQVRHEGNREADKPCVTVEAHEQWRNFGCIDHFDLDKKTREAWERAHDKCDYRNDAKTVGKAVFTVRLVKRCQIQLLTAPNKVVRD
jgi:hypothetical protein